MLSLKKFINFICSKFRCNIPPGIFWQKGSYFCISLFSVSKVEKHFFVGALDFLLFYCLFQIKFCCPLFLIFNDSFNVEVLKLDYQHHHLVDKRQLKKISVVSTVKILYSFVCSNFHVYKNVSN